MVLVFNKTDVKDAAFAKEWMTDFEKFQEALSEEEANGSFGGAEGGGGFQGSGYMGSLLHSMSLVLEEFYTHLRVVGVSSMTGDGVDEFFEAIEEKRKEFDSEYKVELERRRAEHEKNKEKLRQNELGKLMDDLKVGPGKRNSRQAETVSDAEEDEDDSEEDGEEGGSGLQGRYQQALGDSNEAKQGDDMSFVKYLATSQGMKW